MVVFGNRSWICALSDFSVGVLEVSFVLCQFRRMSSLLMGMKE
jgi:hypothetical protein